MRAFAYIGSRRGSASNTASVIERFCALLEKELVDEDLTLFSLKPEDLPVTHCIGCSTCFHKGRCPLDGLDNFATVKQQMLNSDIVIFGSPVYSRTVSSDAKVVIDRLSYWSHTFPLLGRYGVPVITASNNSVLETTRYLTRTMESWGLSIPFSILCTVDAPPMLPSSEFASKLEDQANRLAVLYHDRVLSASNQQEKDFAALKRYYAASSKEGFEADYWRESKYFDHDSFEALMGLMKPPNWNSYIEEQHHVSKADCR